MRSLSLMVGGGVVQNVWDGRWFGIVIGVVIRLLSFLLRGHLGDEKGARLLGKDMLKCRG